MWCIGENIVSKNNNQKISFVEKFLSMKKLFWSKGYGPLKQSKHIGPLIHDFTQIDQLLW